VLRRSQVCPRRKRVGSREEWVEENHRDPVFHVQCAGGARIGRAAVCASGDYRIALTITLRRPVGSDDRVGLRSYGNRPRKLPSAPSFADGAARPTHRLDQKERRAGWYFGLGAACPIPGISAEYKNAGEA